MYFCGFLVFIITTYTYRLIHVSVLVFIHLGLIIPNIRPTLPDPVTVTCSDEPYMYLHVCSIQLCNWTYASLPMINLDVGVPLVSQSVVYTGMQKDGYKVAVFVFGRGGI